MFNKYNTKLYLFKRHFACGPGHAAAGPNVGLAQKSSVGWSRYSDT